jgi:chromosomal replication initiator protein
MLVDPGRTFESLLVHDANRATLRAIRRAGSRAIPLLVVGPAASGKTHLLHAVANDVIARDPGRRLQLITAEWFTTNFVEEIRNGRMREFRARFAQAGTWLIDALEHMEKWDTSEGELERSIRECLENGGSVVLTMSDANTEHVARVARRIHAFEGGRVLRWRRAPIRIRVAAMQRVLRAQHVRLPSSELMNLARSALTVPAATAAIHRALLVRAAKWRAA